jgi:hypothetical protein
VLTDAQRSDISNKRFLEGIKLNDSQDAAQTIHIFAANIVESRAIRLVDPKKRKLKDPGKAIKNGESVGTAVAARFQAGLLSVSEITFDEAHKFAVFRFSLILGVFMRSRRHPCVRKTLWLTEKVEATVSFLDFLSSSKFLSNSTAAPD